MKWCEINIIINYMNNVETQIFTATHGEFHTFWEISATFSDCFCCPFWFWFHCLSSDIPIFVAPFYAKICNNKKCIKNLHLSKTLFVVHILRDSPSSSRLFFSPLFSAATTFSHQHCAPHQKTGDASPFCSGMIICWPES